ncbi:MAG: tetratricopeptide repeat protein [Chloroflexota bacterium]|nr:tetratricopeptide repeat protein [Chloroflexota bacterium]
MREVDRAEQILTEALKLSRRLGDEKGAARALGNLGEVARWRGDLEAAEAGYEQALQIHRRVGWRQLAANNLLNLGLVGRQRANRARAVRHYRDALAEAQALEDRETVAYALAGLAGMSGEAGDFQRAARLLGAVEALLETIGAALEHSERELADADTVAARTALGEERFAAAWEAGRALTWEAAVTEALVTVGSPADGRTDRGGGTG